MRLLALARFAKPRVSLVPAARSALARSFCATSSPPRVSSSSLFPSSPPSPRPTMQNLNDAGAEAFRSWLGGLDDFLVDCDGVLWRGNDGVAGVADTVKSEREDFTPVRPLLSCPDL
jgi:hypothetical protein